MKEKLFSLISFIFDSIKVVAALFVIFLVVAISMGIYRSASHL